ncbi:hypothetical protein Tco_0196513 [Tanacetum coccineum]
MVAYLQKSEGSEGFHQIIDFLNASHIYANGEVELTATIDGQVKTITEASLRRHLKLEDNGGVTTLPNSEIFEQLALMSAPETSLSRITSSPSLSPQHTPVSTPSTSQPPNTQPTPTTKEVVPMPHESHLYNVHLLGRDEGSVSLNELMDLCTSLSKKVGALENELQQTKNTYSTAITKLILRVKKLEQKVKTTKAKRRARIVLLEDVEDSSKQGRKFSEIDIDPSISLVQDEEPLWFQEDTKIQEKNKHSTVIPEVSTAAANLVYIRRSAQKRKDKGKAIIEEDESVQKKTKKQLEQERLGHEEAIRLQEQIDKEERQRITRDAEIAKHDPAMLRYHAQLNRPYSVVEVRKNMVMYLKNQGGYKMNYFKGMKKKTLAKKRAGEKKSDQSAKRQKTEYEKEKEELKAYLDLVLREEFAMEIESLATKYPIVDWKTHVLTENFMYYQIIRADGSSKNYKIFSEMLDDFDRQDILDLHRLVKASWRLYDSCGIHILLMDNGIAIHMMIEKKYPLNQEMLSRMLSKRLEVDHESTMAYELLKFIRSQVQK